MTLLPMANLIVVVVVGLGRAEGRQPARGVVPAQPGHRGRRPLPPDNGGPAAVRARRSPGLRALGRVRSHCRFRYRGNQYVSESCMKSVSGGAKRQCDRALAPGWAWVP
jgi:hypothetical protein